MKAYCGNCEKKVDPFAKMCPYCHEDLSQNRVLEEGTAGMIRTVKGIHYVWAPFAFIMPMFGLMFYIRTRIHNDGSLVETPLLVGIFSYVTVYGIATTVSFITTGSWLPLVSGETFLLMLYEMAG